MKIKALVAVRSGSVRVENKNLRSFAGTNLLKIKLEQLLRIPLLDGIVLNSNDDEMLAVGKKLGVECVKRDSFYASNKVKMSDVFVNMAENCDTDLIVYTNVTNPLLKDKTLSDAILFYLRNSSVYNSVNSAHLLKEFMFLDGTPLNFDPKNQPRSQDLPDIYVPNAAFSILTKETMITSRNIVASNPYMYEIDYYEATDIDNVIDFEIAEFLYQKHKVHTAIPHLISVN